MKMVSSARIKAVIAVFVVIALQANIKHCWKGATLYNKQRGKDKISIYLNRFLALKQELPPCGVVGYLSDNPLTSKEFSLAQYALMPVIVDQTTGHPLVIGNFRSPTIDSTLVSEHGLELLKDFGNGVMLFKGHTN